MGQQANITVFDGLATPVSHTFTGDGVSTSGNESIAWWKELIATVPEGAQNRIATIRRLLKNSIKQTILRVICPVMEIPSGGTSSGLVAAPKVAFEDRVDIIFYHHPRSTEESKRRCLQMALNLLNNNSTTTTAVSSGVVADLHQRLVIPT